MRLTGKTALITGAASGMGAATAKRFVAEGAKVCLADVLADEGAALARTLGDNAFFAPLDITVESQWAAAVEAVLAKWGRLDILVNNAGVTTRTTEIFTADEWDRLLTVNAKGAFLGLGAAVPHMLKQGAGAVVNIASIAAEVGVGIHFGYGASKGAIRTMTRAAAVQFARQGVRVNCIEPGLMPAMRGSAPMDVFPEQLQRMLDTIPMGRMGEVDDVANAVLFLASDEARYITGVELAVDGGYLVQ